MSDYFTMMEKLQGLLDSDDVEIVRNDGRHVRGRIDNLRSTQPFSKPGTTRTDCPLERNTPVRPPSETAMKRPFGLKLALSTLPRWPRKTRTRAPSAARQIAAV